LSDGFNGADLRNVVTEAGMFAIRDDREYVNQEDLTKAARKVGEAKKHESELASILCLHPIQYFASQDGIFNVDALYVHRQLIFLSIPCLYPSCIIRVSRP